MKKYLRLAIIELFFVGLVIALDLITKATIYEKVFNDGKMNLINGVLSFFAVQNTGASFGIFDDKTIVLTIVSAVSAIGLLVFLIVSIKERNLMLRIALILIIGGAIGNLIDRVALGYVRDFIYFELINFAVFNVADSALTIGTILLVIYVLFFYKQKEKRI